MNDHFLQVVGILISAHPLEDVSSDFTIKVLNLSLARVGKDGSLLNIDLKLVSAGSFFLQLSDPTHQELFQYIAGVRQLTQLLLGMEDLSSEDDHTPPSPDKLQEVISHCHKALCHFLFHTASQLGGEDLEMRQFITMHVAQLQYVFQICWYPSTRRDTL